LDTKMEFQVRINSRASLEEMVARVSRLFQCEFRPSHAKLFEGAPAFEAELLGLWITLSYRSRPESDFRNYQLVGTLQDRLEVKWEIPSAYLDIDPYILTLLRRWDAEEWYIPDVEELRRGPRAPGSEGAG